MGVSFVLWAAGITRPCRFPISRRRGRCPHRPAGNGRFMAVFRRVRVDFPFRVVGADDPVRPPETPVFTEIRCEFETFQWADRVVRPYEEYEKPHASSEKSLRLPFRTVAGRCGHRPLQTGYDRPFVSSNSVHQISAVPRYFGRKKSSDFADVGRIREIYIPRRRGRCPHRPAGNGRFMAVFRRIRVDFPFCTVGADDPVRPPETPVFTEIRCEIATFQWADRVVRPYKGC